jgi:hypothetical protein
MGDGHNIWLWVYKVVIIVWIVFGLGYLVMILGFITKGITSKKVRIVIAKRLNGIRVTRENLSRDVEYMRRVVNELYLMKVKPVYEDDNNAISASDEWFLDEASRIRLRRTFSFDIPGNSSRVGVEVGLGNSIEVELARRFSEGDLERISKSRTFDNANASESQISPNDLLAHLVASLQGNITHVIEAVNELEAYENEETDEAFGSGDFDEDEEYLEVNPGEPHFIRMT